MCEIKVRQKYENGQTAGQTVGDSKTILHFIKLSIGSLSSAIAMVAESKTANIYLFDILERLGD